MEEAKQSEDPKERIVKLAHKVYGVSCIARTLEASEDANNDFGVDVEAVAKTIADLASEASSELFAMDLELNPLEKETPANKETEKPADIQDGQKYNFNNLSDWKGCNGPLGRIHALGSLIYNWDEQGEIEKKDAASIGEMLMDLSEDVKDKIEWFERGKLGLNREPQG